MKKLMLQILGWTIALTPVWLALVTIWATQGFTPLVKVAVGTIGMLLVCGIGIAILIKAEDY